jgi:hypothetical protein
MNNDKNWNTVVVQLQKITQHLKEKVWPKPKEKKDA